MKKKNIVVTGASGRLGSALLSHLSKITQLNIFPVSTRNKKGFYSYDEFFTDEFLGQTDVIVHLAWSSVPKTSEENFGGEWLEDIPLLVRLLQAVRSGGHSHIHLIFFSSAGTVYGKHAGKAATETTPCNPVNLYGWGKLHAEQLLQQFNLRFPISVTILRISNVYGMGSKINDQQGVIPYSVKAALQNIEMCIWGDGTAQKDYLYIADLIEVVETIIFRGVSGLFNVCFGKSYSLNDIIQRVEHVTGKEISVQYITAPSWDNDLVAINGRKICNHLAWKPKIDIETGVEKLIGLRMVDAG